MHVWYKPFYICLYVCHGVDHNLSLFSAFHHLLLLFEPPAQIIKSLDSIKESSFSRKKDNGRKKRMFMYLLFLGFSYFLCFLKSLFFNLRCHKIKVSLTYALREDTCRIIEYTYLSLQKGLIKTIPKFSFLRGRQKKLTLDNIHIFKYLNYIV